MNKIFAIAMLGACAGCFAPAPQAPTTWCIDVDTDLVASRVNVSSPYDGQHFVVIRGDGSVAYDSYNSFLSRPASQIRAAVRADSNAPELFVRRLALDCSTAGERKAIVELAMESADKSIVKSFASANAADGNYSKAFGTAFAEAAAKLNARLKR